MEQPVPNVIHGPMAREDFPSSVKTALAERAGSCCSFPDCGAFTTGPSAEGDDRSARTGMACHIYAASDQKPARRRSPGGIDLTSATNGIWMCFKHGKLIDADECTYTVEQLFAWKRIAEVRADFRQKVNREPTTRDYLKAGAELPAAGIDFDAPEAESQRIGKLLLEQGATLVWGERIAHAVRDFAVEVLRNAFEHGRAKHVQVRLSSVSLEIEDTGRPFDIFHLPKTAEPRGGARALSHMLDLTTAGVIVTSRRLPDRNLTAVTLTSSLEAALAANPCMVAAPVTPLRSMANRAELKVEPPPGCAKTYLVFRYVSFSDVRHTLFTVEMAIQNAGPNANISVVLPECSEGVLKYLRELAPDLEILAHVRADEAF